MWRPYVRKTLGKGHVVVFFFCARQHQNEQDWHYHFVGFGTVLSLVHPRAHLWTNEAYDDYRRFYNVLASLEDGHLVQHETLYPDHPDWEDRADAPYVLSMGTPAPSI